MPFGLSGQPVVWQSGQGKLSVAEHVRVLEDPDGHLNLDDVLTPAIQDLFKLPKKDILSFGITDSYYWLGLEIENLTQENLVIELSQYALPVCEFYLQNDSGGWNVKRTGYSIPIKDRIWQDHFQVFSLKSGVNRIYFKVQSYSPPISVLVREEGEYAFSSIKLKIAYGVYLGILVFVILNNLFLFFSLRSYIYLLYCLLVVMHIFVAGTVMDGFAMYGLPWINLKLSYILVPALTMLVTTAYGLIFLEVKKYSKKLNLIGWVWFAYIFIVVGLQAVLPYMVSVILNQIHAVLGLFLTVYMGFFVARRGNKVGYYFAAAYGLYFFITILEIFHIQTGSPDYIFGVSHVAIAILMEVLLLSYALSKRFQWEREENVAARLEAQKLVVEKTKENERIVLSQNVILEERVGQRTKQLERANIQLSNTLQTVEEEKAKSDALLLNILPKSTAEELKEKGYAEPRYFENVSVLFTDFKDFTSTTTNMTPQRLLEDLNECFKAFDDIVKSLGLEKIKTIGDSYMAAVGLPKESSEHAVLAVKCALQMKEFINDWQESQLKLGRPSWEIRIGIHSGPVVAGVVGYHKFAYDIWGDAVNIAARMENNSAAGKINISDNTYNLVKEYFECSPRGMMEVKGKGEMKMYWVEGELTLK